jgi:ABC-type Fe3+/spermidine/putrescine transport system ATPase subunit
LEGGLSLPAVTADSESERLLCIRPEKWRLTVPDASEAIAADIADMNFVGDRVEYAVDTAAGRLSVTELGGVDRRIGDRVGLQVSAQDIKLISP